MPSQAGCGLRVPTVRRNSEKLLKATARHGTVLIRINPERPDVRGRGATSAISIRAPAAEALRRIDDAIRERLRGRARAS